MLTFFLRAPGLRSLDADATSQEPICRASSCFLDIKGSQTEGFTTSAFRCEACQPQVFSTALVVRKGRFDHVQDVCSKLLLPMQRLATAFAGRVIAGTTVALRITWDSLSIVHEGFFMPLRSADAVRCDDVMLRRGFRPGAREQYTCLENWLRRILETFTLWEEMIRPPRSWEWGWHCLLRYLRRSFFHFGLFIVRTICVAIICFCTAMYYVSLLAWRFYLNLYQFALAHADLLLVFVSLPLPLSAFEGILSMYVGFLFSPLVAATLIAPYGGYEFTFDPASRLCALFDPVSIFLGDDACAWDASCACTLNPEKIRFSAVRPKAAQFFRSLRSVFVILMVAELWAGFVQHFGLEEHHLVTVLLGGSLGVRCVRAMIPNHVRVKAAQSCAAWGAFLLKVALSLALKAALGVVLPCLGVGCLIVDGVLIVSPCIAKVSGACLVALFDHFRYVVIGVALTQLPRALCVCQVCQGFFDGCTGGHDGMTCQYAQGVTANAVAIASAGTAALSLVGMFRPKVTQVFTSSVLSVLKAYATSPVAGTPFSLSGKSGSDLVDAVFAGKVPKVEVISYFARQLDDLKAERDDGVRKSSIDVITAQMTLLNSVDFTPSDRAAGAGVTEGVYVFTWGKCSEVVMEKDGKITLGSSSKDKATVVSKVYPPATEAQFYEILMLWQAMVVHVGLAQLAVTHEFIQNVVSRPVREKGFSWMAAHELILAYLSHLDSSTNSALTLVNIYTSPTLGVDDMRSVAEASITLRFGGRAIFRSTPGGRAPGGEGSGDGVTFNNKDTPTAPKPCEAWNRGNSHVRKHLRDDGSCLFRHRCSKWIKLANGKVGYCFRGHRIGECDRDATELSSSGPK